MSYLNYNSLIEYEKLINGVRDWPDTLDAFDMNKYLDARSKNRRRSDKRNLNTYTFKYISREPILYKKKKKLTFLGFHIERIFISPSSETYNVHLYWFNKKIFTFKKNKTMENLVKISEKIEMIKALGNICMFKESGTNDTLINVSRKKCIEIINSIQLGNEKL